MANELIKTFDNKILEVQHIIALLQQVVDRYKTAKRFEANEFKRGVATPALLDAALIGIIDNIGDIFSAEITNALSAFTIDAEVWKATLYPGMLHEAAGWTSTNINATAGTLTAVQSVTTALFDTVFAVNDVIEITNAENPENNGLHTLHDTTVPTGQVITLASAIAGGVDNTTDETAIISLHRKA